MDESKNTQSRDAAPRTKGMHYAVIALVAVLVAVIVFGIVKFSSMNSQIEQALAENAELQLTNEQLQLSNEFDAFNSEFAQYENQIMNLPNDSIMAKYEAAKSRIESLMEELEQAKKEGNRDKAKIAELQAKIRDLQAEIDTLKALLRHYIAQIDSLGKENEGLKAENTEIRNQNQQLSNQVSTTARENAELSERMTLAEKLNVTNVTLTGLKNNGKEEKNITKAHQLMVTFTIPQNNSTPVGAKTIYLRLLSPEGQLLGGAGSFSFEGASLKYSTSKTIDYGGEEITGIKMYWDVSATLTPGTYTVELFADNYRLCSKQITKNK